MGQGQKDGPQKTSRDFKRLGGKWCQLVVLSNFTSKVPLSAVRLLAKKGLVFVS